LRREQQWREQ
jgi:hypothetical protein